MTKPFGPGRVNVSARQPMGKTAMGAYMQPASAQCGPEYRLCKQHCRAVNSGMNGWMFKVNGVVPMVPAKDKLLSKGDEVVWWYSTDMDPQVRISAAGTEVRMPAPAPLRKC